MRFCKCTSIEEASRAQPEVAEEFELGTRPEILLKKTAHKEISRTLSCTHIRNNHILLDPSGRFPFSLNPLLRGLIELPIELRGECASK